MCVYAPTAIHKYWRDFTYMIGRIIFAAFYFRLMALAFDVIDRRGPSDEMRCHAVTAKEDLGKAVLAIYIAAKTIFPVLHY